MIDPRLSILDKRLENISNIYVFASGKGGVGKSSCSTVSALLLAKRGYKVGLLDLDFQGASDHIFLGEKLSFPREERGILPYTTSYGLGFMSIAGFIGDGPAPMRGEDLTNAFIELLAITAWGDLDFLVIDMPPGIGDEVLDLIRYVKESTFIIVTSPSQVSGRVAKRLIQVLKSIKAKIGGVIENGVFTEKEAPGPGAGKKISSELALKFLGSIPFIDDFESRLGNPELLVNGPFANRLANALDCLNGAE